MRLEAMHSWRAVDWARYWFYRHYTDVLLTLVLGVCTLQLDAVHAVYLALALLFFRCSLALCLVA